MSGNIQIVLKSIINNLKKNIFLNLKSEDIVVIYLKEIKLWTDGHSEL